VNPSFWRHENVRYLYTTATDSMVPPDFRRVVGPVRNALGSMVYLYQLPGENPAAWVASAMVKGSDEQALATVLDQRFDPSRAAILDTGAAIQTADLATAPAPAGVKADVTRLEPGVIDVRLDAPAPTGAALVVSENFYPGWRATADGRDAQVARANFNLIGVALPAGAREIRLRFTDEAFSTGRAVTLAALIVALAAIVAGVVMQRRHPVLAANDA
jgi:hypothetical protein